MRNFGVKAHLDWVTWKVITEHLAFELRPEQHKESVVGTKFKEKNASSRKNNQGTGSEEEVSLTCSQTGHCG